MAYFYEHQNENFANLQINEYIILKDPEGNVIDKLCWTGETYRPLKFSQF